MRVEQAIFIIMNFKNNGYLLDKGFLIILKLLNQEMFIVYF